ncbi:AraC family transcriptional regulator [Bosea minatitlanensis]|uniref:Helix-turn-helix transcriptional regulator n=1 Tax=Bosea minatitlanensis TaxID=128782 RepID=A0ABW0F977_9HYPH|nr:AraC family transcriptional regulator [Bosea minatitlanensis]MCT4494880.1 AraC family transcriptional regulator [Bosea minatitlanensis]
MPRWDAPSERLRRRLPAHGASSRLKLVIVEGGELLCKLPDQPQSGKALEIAAHAVAAFDASEPRDLPRLATSDIELHLARDIRAARLRNPPSLAEFSAATGLNARKLKAGFQRVFEDSVYGYLQSLRLEEASRLLSAGDMNVSSVAYRVGYSPAHLSVAFRKRFRLSPKQLKP